MSWNNRPVTLFNIQWNPAKSNVNQLIFFLSSPYETKSSNIQKMPVKRPLENPVTSVSEVNEFFIPIPLKGSEETYFPKSPVPFLKTCVRNWSIPWKTLSYFFSSFTHHICLLFYEAMKKQSSESNDAPAGCFLGLLEHCQKKAGFFAPATSACSTTNLISAA